MTVLTVFTLIGKEKFIIVRNPFESIVASMI